MSLLRRSFGKLPAPVRKSALQAGRKILTEVFAIPDPFLDLAKIVAQVRPVAILDVGAHIGETSIALARLFPTVAIHAFEPTRASFELLEKNTSHLPLVHRHQLALGSAPERQRFFLNQNAQTNSLLDNDRGNDSFLANDTGHLECIEVEVARLDDWAASANLPPGPIIIKADVQGAELHLLDGGVETLGRRTAALYTEVSVAPLYVGQADLLALLSRIRALDTFDLYQLYRTRSNEFGRALWLDALWVRSDIVAAIESQ